jgi:hypothetical protein
MLTILPSGNVARVDTNNLFDCSIDGVAVFLQRTGEVIGLPHPDNDTFFIVSAMVRTAVPGRPDVLSPGDPIRDEAGQIVGCTGFIGN